MAGAVIRNPPDVTPVDVASDCGFRRACQLFSTYEASRRTGNGLLKDSPSVFVARVKDGLFKIREITAEERRWRVISRLCAEGAPFGVVWKSASLRGFDELRSYLGAIATVFPTTAQVEGDFSVHKLALRGRERLSHFGCQSDAHVKQFGEV